MEIRKKISARTKKVVNDNSRKICNICQLLSTWCHLTYK
jgi:hypothetical protein